VRGALDAPALATGGRRLRHLLTRAQTPNAANSGSIPWTPAPTAATGGRTPAPRPTGSAGSSASNGDNVAPRIILDLVRQKPADHPWYSPHRAASDARCTRTSRPSRTD